MNCLSSCLKCASALLLALAVAGSARAHEVGLSSATVQWHSNRLEAVLTFAVREAEALTPLDANHDGLVSPDEFGLARAALIATVATNCQVRFDGVAADASDLSTQLDNSNNVDVALSFPNPEFEQLEMDLGVIRRLTPGHRMFFTLFGPAGETVAERLLSQSSTLVLIQFDPAAQGVQPTALVTEHAPPPSFAGFVKLGVEHILTGYDHLLFLFALLLVTRDFTSAFKVITCFTLAHSITLGVATFDLVQIPSRIVEPLIAATIVYVGAENIWKRGDPHGRWLLTFAFGLIHGFGFASKLRDMGIGARGGGVAMPVFSFNLGVELGQLAVAAIALPIIWRLRKRDLFLHRGVPASSAVVALAGAYWFAQRVWPV